METVTKIPETEVNSGSHTRRTFHLHHTLHKLAEYLPDQSPLHEFVHHNTLHAFQHLPFHIGLATASNTFGFNTYLPLSAYHQRFEAGEITISSLEKAVEHLTGEPYSHWQNLLFDKKPKDLKSPVVGQLREAWIGKLGFNLDAVVQPILFRTLGSFLDQGIAEDVFPLTQGTFLEGIREIEKHASPGFFKHAFVKQKLADPNLSVESLLWLLVGNEKLFEAYLFDQQFGHPGWSGMVSAVERRPHSLLDSRKISIEQLIIFELLLELDALIDHLGKAWPTVAEGASTQTEVIPAVPDQLNEQQTVLAIWQHALEWSYFDQVIAGLRLPIQNPESQDAAAFQAFFCIDDRECSLRRYVEQIEPSAKTFGTPGFFGVPFYYQPENGKFYTKLCPAPMQPSHLIKARGKRKSRKEYHIGHQTHGLFTGWLVAQTVGFWAALKLFFNIFKPSFSPATSSSFRHMEPSNVIDFEAQEGEPQFENGLQIGFTPIEMAMMVENVLRGAGLTQNFAPLVYMVGHGATSANNPHYAAYDCGACSGKPGSVNARVFAAMANHANVRELLKEKGIEIPAETRFVSALHDTTRDEITYYDLDELSDWHRKKHRANHLVFQHALQYNAKERSRRFELVNTHHSKRKVHQLVKLRSVSLFEPRPELNHATNALCIVGRRSFSDHLFLDRRAFMNSYDYRTDPEGQHLLNILKAVAPVCGGINLEYYFSKVDNEQLGAGSKLPHNVVGLFGVANGMEGDLRPGLPAQMTEIHDPLRLMVVVEQMPNVVLNCLKESPETLAWFTHEWIHLVAMNPETKEAWVMQHGKFEPYKPYTAQLPEVANIAELVEHTSENIPVTILKHHSI